MFCSRRGTLSGWVIRAAAFVYVTGGTAFAGAAGVGGVADYALTESALAKFERAQKNLADVPSSARGDCDDAGDGDDSSPEAIAARIDARPQARSAIESAGLSSLEYAQFVIGVMQAGMAVWVLDQPGGQLPPGVSMDDVNFYRANQTRLAVVGNAGSSTDCEE